MIIDSISNYCSLLSLGFKKFSPSVDLPVTKLNIQLTRAFIREGLLKGFQKTGLNKLKIFLNYNFKGQSLPSKIIRESKSKKYGYLSVAEIKKYKKCSLFFLSTTKGIISNNEAIFFNQGGKIIVSIKF